MKTKILQSNNKAHHHTSSIGLFLMVLMLLTLILTPEALNADSVTVNDTLPSKFVALVPAYNYECSFVMLVANGTYATGTHISTITATSNSGPGSLDALLKNAGVPTDHLAIAQGMCFISPFRTREQYDAYQNSDRTSDMTEYTLSLLGGLQTQVTINSVPVSFNVRSNASKTVRIKELNMAIASGSPITQNVYHNNKNTVPASVNVSFNGSGASNDISFNVPWNIISTTQEVITLGTYTTAISSLSSGYRVNISNSIPAVYPEVFGINNAALWTYSTSTWDKHGALGVTVPAQLTTVTVRAVATATGYYNTAQGYVGPELYVCVPRYSYVLRTGTDIQYVFSSIVSDRVALWSDTDNNELFHMVPAQRFRSMMTAETTAQLDAQLLKVTRISGLANLIDNTTFVDRAYQWGYNAGDQMP